MAELRKVRNIKPGFKKGLWFGLFNAGWETVSGGLSPWTLKVTPDWSSLHKLGEQEEPRRDYVQRTLHVTAQARRPGRTQARLRAAHPATARPPGRRVLQIGRAHV